MGSAKLIAVLTSVARFNFLRSPPDRREIRVLATSRRPISRSKYSMRWFFRAFDHLRSNFNSPIKYKCSVGVSESMVISNCGTKHEILVIVLRSIEIPLIVISPCNGPRKRCAMHASKVVFPAPLAPSTATNWPLFKFPLTFSQKIKQKSILFDYEHRRV